MLLAGSMIKI